MCGTKLNIIKTEIDKSINISNVMKDYMMYNSL